MDGRAAAQMSRGGTRHGRLRACMPAAVAPVAARARVHRGDQHEVRRKRRVSCARLTVTNLSSSGCGSTRGPSAQFRQFIQKTPRWLALSPAAAAAAATTSPACEIVWCGARNGRCGISGACPRVACRRHAVDLRHLKRFIHSHPWQHRAGRPRQQRLPAPGGPTMTALCRLRPRLPAPA